MSESDEDVPVEPGRGDIWIEHYRPQRLEDIVGHENIIPRLQSYVEQDDLPNLLFAGPAGTGKCVTGETPVLTDRGLERIEGVVGEVDGFEAPRPGLEVLTLDDGGEFSYVSPDHVFGREADELLEVQTRDGGETTVTPEHQFLVLDHDGFLWKQAEDLSEGDQVVRPETIPTLEKGRDLDWMEQLDPDRIHVQVTEAFAHEHSIPAEEQYVGKKKTVFRYLRKGWSADKIRDHTGIALKTVHLYRREAEDVDLKAPSTVCSLGYFRSRNVADGILREHVVSIQAVSRFNKRSEPITPPWELTPELAFLLGMSISEAAVSPSRIKFYNTEEAFLDRFETAIEEVFGIDVDHGVQQECPYVAVRNKTVTAFLRSCFAVFDGETSDLGSTLVYAEDDVRAAFLRAIFDAEGHVTKRGYIELTQKDGDLITLLSYLLTGFGIPCRRTTECKAATNGSGRNRPYHTLYISGTDHLIRFHRRIGFDHPDKAERLASQLDRNSNPNHDTIPTQAAVDRLCERLALTKREYVPESLNPETPSRTTYVGCLDRLVADATSALESAQHALERLDRLEPVVESVSDLPLAWASQRELMVPVERRHEVATTTGTREDALLTYADGRRTPRASRAVALLQELEYTADWEGITRLQTELQDIIEALGVSYNRVAAGTSLRGTDVKNLLTNDDLAVRSLPRFGTIVDRLDEELHGMLSQEVLADLTHLEVLTSSELYFDEVEAVEPVEKPQRVYDLSVSGTRNYVAGAIPTVMHNTTAAQAIARELYGDNWDENFLELNASDERGIDVVRGRIKEFARASFGGYDYRIIFLDEADSLTSDAQSALRRTMEQFSHNTRFILSCNYSSRIIDPIQSRCAVFRFTSIDDEAIAGRIREIADNEGIEVTDEGVDAIVYAAAGDMRKAINALQGAAVLGETVDAETVYTITSTAKPEVVEEMVTKALDGDFQGSRKILSELLDDAGLAGGDVIDQLHRSVWDFELDDRAAVDLLERIGEADYRISEGANERIQLEALLASVARGGSS